MHTRFDTSYEQDLDTRRIYVTVVCLGCKSRSSITITEEKVINDRNALSQVINQLIDAHAQAYS